MTSPVNANGALACPSGTISAATSTVASPTTGPARKTQLVVRLKTQSFRINLARS